jgi:hypothetical protein
MDAATSGAIAAWLQFIGIVGTAVVGVIVANRQLGAQNEALKAANDNQRLQTSMKVLDDMRAVTELQDQKCSPLDATLYVIKVANDKDERRRYRTFLERKEYADPTAANDARFYDATKTKAGIAAFYYMDLYDLIDRHRLDNLYVMAKVGAFVQPFYKALGEIGNEFHQNPRLEALVDMSKELIADARQTLERLKVEDG